MGVEEMDGLTLCMLGCGNLGLAILQNLVNPPETADATKLPIQHFTVCVRSSATEQKLADKFRTNADTVIVSSGKNLQALKKADVIILAVDPADIVSTLKEQGVAEALSSPHNGRPKLLISVAAGWTRQDLEKTIFGTPTDTSNAESGRAWIIRTLPNIAAQVTQSLTAIEISDPTPPSWALELCDTIFTQIGKTVHIPPALMDATTAVAGSTPAFFAVICDALIDAAVAVGVPRPLAHTMTFQSMLGTATMMQGGLHPALFKDQGSFTAGCDIGGFMVWEDGAVRGHMGKALREAVTIARQMGKNPHVNDTRQ
ncbi:pyrroline-5-carboxylate reductase [Verticillium dahliae VdLs.17]|uniref:Pyrroline-5-carboxylate reductase n=1 Tax=Verticillium dahliae (strain VdLs.17 / ATCC MYA-4575 / FGSC 10137) TaxID=498257 RepID=G2WZR0_VERDV|nr:pyrroline-5-carboxylate reductase [Verticillium dahliae VdLs.17]EGY22062.1 pyrroline-5-carboxylate reductase [Verticillium dahliae VdLs.17]